MFEPVEPCFQMFLLFILVLSTLRGHVGLHFTFVGIHMDGKRTLAGRTRSQRNPLGGCLRRACPWSLQYALGTLGEMCCVVDAEDVTSKVIPSVTLQKVIESQIHFTVANLGKFSETPQTTSHWLNSLHVWHIYIYNVIYIQTVLGYVGYGPSSTSIAQETGSSSKGSARVRARHQGHQVGQGARGFGGPLGPAIDSKITG